MAVLHLISEQEVKDLTSLGDNVDVKKFRHWIQVAQDIYMKPAIGETCYDLLLDSVENDDPTALETILLDGDNRSFAGLKIALAHWVVFLAFPDLWINTGNTTLQKRTGDNFETVTMEEFSLKRKQIEQAASSYTNYLISYIQKHRADSYPCYVCDGLTPLIDDTQQTGIALDNDKLRKLTEEAEVLRRDNKDRTWRK